MSSCPDFLIKTISSSIESYNRTRKPEATARLLEFDEKHGFFKVEFTGSFCLTCGLRDWLEDLAYILRSEGVDAVLEDHVEKDEFKIIGLFKIKGLMNNGC
ncbi:hypothetical protein IMZ38_04705 [Thermosphaera chiliense]|uniref:Uncharacterized protein n=1 Tax=Thermosphaera chiliense TaxID=3402707 RepID=A0A7M1UP16_9CREN|nr:hypothetical protein [Thermosphaera aggregans]QOR93951.1 hypothetical protein IMZ38_04705 [Thermosphaera aggregans]